MDLLYRLENTQRISSWTSLRGSAASTGAQGKVVKTMLLMLLSYFIAKNEMPEYVNAHSSEAAPLMAFMSAVDPHHFLQSNWSGSDPCEGNWLGVFCQKGYVYDLILQSMGLSGSVPPNTLDNLTQLRRISLKNNSLSGPLPDLSKSAESLLAIWLKDNQFHGPIPDIFQKTHRLRRIELSGNQIIGIIPLSLAFVVNLTGLRLESNQLSGTLPPFNQTTLKDFNVSSNQLSGPIPDTYMLQHAFSSSLANNPQLCGKPLSTPCSIPSPPPPQPPKEGQSPEPGGDKVPTPSEPEEGESSGSEPQPVPSEPPQPSAGPSPPPNTALPSLQSPLAQGRQSEGDLSDPLAADSPSPLPPSEYPSIGSDSPAGFPSLNDVSSGQKRIVIVSRNTLLAIMVVLFVALYKRLL